LVYAEGSLIHTRRWTWRQGENAKIGPDASEMLFVVDGFVGVNDDAVHAATDRITELLVTLFAASAKTGLACATGGP
jgi:DNA/RNA-binding domain of Phe-tRNA-synthetase-like protein